ncbi:MAG: type II toxin-antitoxin system HigB family toxin [Hyphomicrobiales bacterium]|nr:type II toxin-antitoxin system HigB family toxin [Hyphomicrobiales bacterium]
MNGWSVLPASVYFSEVGSFALAVRFAYRFKSAPIEFVGTHAEYDRIDAETV